MNMYFRHFLIATAIVTGNFLSVLPLQALAQEPANPSVKSTETNSESEKILTVIRNQQDAWNKGDVEAFMTGYWKSEKMSFAGGGKVVHGWQATLDRYKSKYPKEKMGKLTFSDLEVSLVGNKAAMVLGNFHLDQSGEISQGGFTLVFEKMDNGWKIIHDHTSSLAADKKN